MGQRLTIHEVRENIEYVLERIQNQSENYTLDKITKSLEKVEEKYNKAYADYCVSKNCLNARKAKSLATRKKLLFYTKLIMEATCSSCIKDLNEIDIDLDKKFGDIEDCLLNLIVRSSLN